MHLRENAHMHTAVLGDRTGYLAEWLHTCWQVCPSCRLTVRVVMLSICWRPGAVPLPVAASGCTRTPSCR